MEDTCYICDDCGQEHDKQRFVQIRLIQEGPYKNAHWRQSCQICKRISYNNEGFVHDKVSYEEHARSQKLNLVKNS